MVLGRTAAQGKEEDSVFAEEHLGTDETMRPVRGDMELPAEELDVAMSVRSTQEDDSAARGLLEIEGPWGGERATDWGPFLTVGGTLANGMDETVGLLLEGGEGREVKSAPDLGLPTAVEALDAVLETGFTGRSKDRYDAQAQAHARHSAQDIQMVLRSEETSVVIKLGKVRQAEFAPVIEDAVHGGFSGYAIRREGGGEASEDGDAVEDVDLGTALDGQILHDVEAVEFSGLGGEGRQVPADRWGEVSDAAPAIQSSPAFQDAADGSEGGAWGNPNRVQLAKDGRGSKLAQIAVLLEIRAKTEDEILDSLIAAIGRTRADRGAIGEVDAVQATIAGAATPELDRGQTDTETPRHLAHGDAASDQRDHGLAPLPGSEFCVMLASSIDPIPLHGDREALTLK